jgi:hypothetical protein
MTKARGCVVGGAALLLALVGASVACSSSTSSPAPLDGGSDGPAADAALDGAAEASSVALCTAGFGTPSTLSMALVGQPVVLRGVLEKRLNTTIALPKESQCTDSSHAIALMTTELPNEPVQIVDGKDVYCGCADNASAGCERFALGPTVLVKGVLSREETGVCNQLPCYHLAFEASCRE